MGIFNHELFFMVISVAAGINEGFLHTLSRDDLRDLFPGPEHFLRRNRVWALINPEVICYLVWP